MEFYIAVGLRAPAWVVITILGPLVAGVAAAAIYRIAVLLPSRSRPLIRKARGEAPRYVIKWTRHQ